MTAERDLDVVLYGATGFVGKLTARYLARNTPEGARIGLGGRNEAKLAQVRSELGPRAADWPLLVADSQDTAALAAMAQRARAVATTVGPYQKYGFPLVQACAEAGTHYADLTGELLFMRETIDRFDATARESGAKIVHSCGFDSIPSDLGVLELHRAVQRDGAANVSSSAATTASRASSLAAGTTASSRSMTISSASSVRPLASLAAGAAGTTRIARRRGIGRTLVHHRRSRRPAVAPLGAWKRGSTPRRSISGGC